MRIKGESPKEGYMSRKYTSMMVGVAICAVAIVLSGGKEPQWGYVLIGVLAQYTYGNVQEGKTQKELEVMRMNGKPPVEGAGQ